MKSFFPKFSDRFCDKHKIREDRDTRRYYGGASGLSFVGSVAKNGAFRDGSGTVRGYISGGSYRRTR